MFKGILHTHVLVVSLFLLIYLIKTALLLLNRKKELQKFTGVIKIPEMVISFLFLASGIYLWIYTGNKGLWLYVKLAAVIAVIPISIIGFKKQNKILAIVSFLLLVYIYGMSETKAIAMKPSKKVVAIEGMDPSNPRYGKEVYDLKCKSCHGDDGKLGLSGAKDLIVSKMNDDEMSEIVKEGKGVMKGMKKELSEEQVKAVLDYVRRLREAQD